MERVNNSRLAVTALSLLLVTAIIVPVKSFGLSSRGFGFVVSSPQPQIAFSRNLYGRDDTTRTRTTASTTSLSFSTGPQGQKQSSPPESSVAMMCYSQRSHGHYDFRLRFKVDEELMKEFGEFEEESNKDDKKDDDADDEMDDDDIENESELVEYMATVMVNRLLGMKVLRRRLQQQQQHKEKATAAAAAPVGQKEKVAAKQEEKEKEDVEKAAKEKRVVDKTEEVPSVEVDADKEEEKEVHELLHKKEGDRNLALKDEFLDEPELKEEKEELKPETTDAETELAPASTITADSPPLPAQISLDFGRPLTVIQSNLPAANLTAVVEPKPKQSEEPAVAVAEKPVETSKATTIVPPSKQTQTEPANDALGEKENEEAVIAVKAPIITPPPSSASSSDSTNEKNEDDTDEKDSESTTVVEAVRSPIITPPSPPSAPSLEKSENAQQQPHPVEEKKEEESPKSETVKAQSSSSPAATKSPVITPTAPPAKDESSTNDDDADADADEAAKELTLEEKASKILFDLGLAEKHQDPADPSYDHSHDDETAPENRYKTSEKRP